MYQWWRAETALLDRPDFGSYLDNQSDPQEMIDAMVQVIPADDHPYRTVCPETTRNQGRDFQAEVWAARA